MATETAKSEEKAGIATLPKPWATAVQLVGTFGLAVFLVLYYVLVVQPRDSARYEELRASVQNLAGIVSGEAALLTSGQVEAVESLYIEAASWNVAEVLAIQVPRGVEHTDLTKMVEDALILATDHLRGLAREDGRLVSETLTHRVRNSDIAAFLAGEALNEWENPPLPELQSRCEERMHYDLRMGAMAK